MPLVEIADEAPEGVMQDASNDPMGIGRIAVVVHPSFEDEVDRIDHVSWVNEALARQFRYCVLDSLLSVMRNDESWGTPGSIRTRFDPSELKAQEFHPLRPVGNQGFLCTQSELEGRLEPVSDFSFHGFRPVFGE